MKCGDPEVTRGAASAGPGPTTVPSPASAHARDDMETNASARRGGAAGGRIAVAQLDVHVGAHAGAQLRRIGGSTLNSAPEAGAIEAMCAFHFTPG